MGADDLIANGKQVAIIDYHNGDSYTNTYGTARQNYYNLSGTPTAWFDGGNTVVGGDHTQSMYSSYLPKYNLRIAVPSSFVLSIYGEKVGLNYTILLIAEKVGSYSGPNPALHLVLTQSNIAQNWQGMTVLNHVERLMAPNENGTIINFASGNIQMATLSFTKNAAWPEIDCELVAFLQNNTGKEILQGIKVPLSGLLPPPYADATLISAFNVPVTSCSGKASPIIKLKNQGSVNLFSATIAYRVNNGSLMNHTWSGNLIQNQTANVQLPQINFSPLENNIFKAYILNANGFVDLNPLNDTVNKAFSSAMDYFSTINLELLTDNNPQQTTWQILNASNQVVFSGGPYTGQPNTLIQQELEFQQSGCYKFIITDSGNDGICCSSGNGHFTLKDINNQVIYTNGDFGPKETVEFGIRISIFDLIAFIEAPFDQWSFEMNTTLNQQGGIPLNQPYNTEPWNYNGAESVTSIPSPEIVDWVLVELRETSGGPEMAIPSTIVGRQAAFLNKYGYIVGLDGTSNLKFDVVINNNLFIVIHHRNHLSIMNAEAIPNFGTIYYFDFSLSPDYIYGGSVGCKNILGSAVMAAGDGNGDGIIDSNDLNYSWGIEAGKKGYYSSDINMNQQVNNQDKNGFLLLNYSMESQVPD
jgi:hypothetical protein